MLKRFALIPEEREKECNHAFLHFRGSMPCTGPKVCSMCGLTEAEIRAEQTQPEPPLPGGRIGFRRPTVQSVKFEDPEIVPETMLDTGISE